MKMWRWIIVATAYNTHIEQPRCIIIPISTIDIETCKTRHLRFDSIFVCAFFLPMFHFKCKFTFRQESASIQDVKNTSWFSTMRQKTNGKKIIKRIFFIAKSNILQYDKGDDNHIRQCIKLYHTTSANSIYHRWLKTRTETAKNIEKNNIVTQASNQRIELNNQPRITFKITKINWEIKPEREQEKKHIFIDSMQRVKIKWETK